MLITHCAEVVCAGTEVRLVLDPTTGLPVYQGDCYINFTVLLPYSCVGNATAPPHACKVVQYGHGLFGDQSEVEVGYLDAEANQYGYGEALVSADYHTVASPSRPPS